MQFQYTVFYTNWHICLCAATILALCSRFGRLYFMVKCFYTLLCSVVQMRNYFHISEQESRKFSFLIYQIAVRPLYLCLFGIIIFKRTQDFPQFSYNQVFFPIHRKTTSCDTLKIKIMKFIFNGLFYEFYFVLIFSLNLVLRIVPFLPSPPTAFISSFNFRSIFRNVSQNIVHS